MGAAAEGVAAGLVEESLPRLARKNPLGFKTIEMSQLVTKDIVDETRRVLEEKSLCAEWAETNYKLGVKYFSYSVARRKLAARLANLFGEGV